MPDRKIPLLPAPASSQLPTSEMRPRRKLLRLVIYSLIATGITTLMYSAYAQVFGPPSEPGLNLNSAKRLGYKQLENIPLRYIPREYDTDLKRLVFIGDVHGMYTELQELLEQINYDKHTDHIVLTGDLVTKGPDSLKVIDFGIENGVSCVRGNQDDRVLLHYLRNKAPSEKQLWVEKALAKKLSKEQAAWLNSCPLILRADDVKGLGNVAIVHAGLIHGVPLDQQDPVAIMTMRSVHRRSRVPSSGTTGTHWARLWNRYEKHERVPLTVIYGHYAARGLDRRPLSQGLDSNCVRGGRLTALVASTRTDNPEVFSVHCRKAYSK
ncbi:Metallo-dependent phosphatase-like protein [Sphaerosporella brunnea]|uniref:Metallo-dependent phosphatase-like protein n=1 Tax=Sphaerosporella brunnea TaxID=1250544 RepID=A0A5J5EZD1_9PEZI|nr:Metallo-dependent phosphatase-like protein [Sphaerosporella brunnea]